MAKRRNGIYQRATRAGIRYDVQVDLGPDPVTGKRRLRKKSFKSAKEAKAAQAAWLTEIAQGQAVDRSSRTVADMLHYLLDTKRTLSAKTLYDYQQTIDRHIIPALGMIAVQDVTTERIQTFYSSLLAAGVGPRTVRLCHMHLSSALKLAMSLKLLPSNPAVLAKQPKERRREMHTWTQEEARCFLTVADQSRYGPIWVLALGTGMRRGELLGLRWRDVDLDQGFLVIRQTIGVLHGRIDVKPPKTAHSRRTVPLTTLIVAALRDHQQRQTEQRQALGEAWQDHDLVFCLGDCCGQQHLAQVWEPCSSGGVAF